MRINSVLRAVVPALMLVSPSALLADQKALQQQPEVCSAVDVRFAKADLKQGWIAQRNFDYEAAAAKYAQVMKSCDPVSRSKAERNFDGVNLLMEKPWWRWGKVVPGLHWWYERPDESAWLTWSLPGKLGSIRRQIISFGAFWLLVFVVVLWVVWPLLRYAITFGKAVAGVPGRVKWQAIDLSSKKRKFRWIGKAFDWFPRFSRQWVLPFLGHARLVLLDKLDDSYEPELFRQQLSAAMEEIRDLVEAAGAGWIAGPTSLLAVPTGVATDLVSKFPEIKGANLAGILAWFLSLFGYFGWRVECGEAFIESSKTVESFAELRWAWFTRERWKIRTPAESKTDLALPAWDLALNVLSARFNNRPAKNKHVEFENADHFVQFMRGAATLQLYDSAGNQRPPDRDAMRRNLASAEESFQQCSVFYPDHLLSRFYLAYVLVLRNQDLVINDLACRIKDLSDEPLSMDSPFLTRAIEMFAKIAESGEDGISHVARYNWAKALVKRESRNTSGRTDLEDAAAVLGTLERQLPVSMKGLQEEERTALELQTRGLIHYVEVRQGTQDCKRRSFIAPPAIREKLENLKKIPDIAKRQREARKLGAREAFDLTSDFQSQISYLYYELARSARALPPNARCCLDEGFKFADAALELKPDWTPAQINKLRLTIECMRLKKWACDSPITPPQEKDLAEKEIARLRAGARRLLTAIRGKDTTVEEPSASALGIATCIVW